jgi:hypothetical protein
MKYMLPETLYLLHTKEQQTDKQKKMYADEREYNRPVSLTSCCKALWRYLYFLYAEKYIPCPKNIIRVEAFRTNNYYKIIKGFEICEKFNCFKTPAGLQVKFIYINKLKADYFRKILLAIIPHKIALSSFFI